MQNHTVIVFLIFIVMNVQMPEFALNVKMDIRYKVIIVNALLLQIVLLVQPIINVFNVLEQKKLIYHKIAFVWLHVLLELSYKEISVIK